MAKGIYTVEAEKYTVVEYIESSKAQYIDTGYVPNQNTRIETHAKAIGVGNYGAADWGAIYGACPTYGSNAIELYLENTSYKFVYGAQIQSLGSAVANDDLIIVQDKNALSLEINGITYTHTFDAVDFSSTNTLTLFALHRESVLLGVARIYSCKIYDNDVLIRDYVPAISPDGSVGLLDKVSNIFYGNAGTGVFTAGEVVEEIETGKLSKNVKKLYVTENIEENAKIEYVDVDGAKYYEVEYIESSGTQYIDTGFNPNQNTRVTIDFTPTVVATSTIFSAYSSSDSQMYGVFCNGSVWKSYWQNTGTNTSVSVVANTRYKVDFNKNLLYIDDVLVRTESELTFTTDQTLSLLVGHGTSAYRYPISAKLYSCRIYDNDVLIRDYVPVITEDGAGGLFDKVSNTFYGNVGTGTFTVGDVKTTDEIVIVGQKASKLKKGYVVENKEVSLSPLPEGYTVYEYIQSSGTQYINTNFYPNQDTRIVISAQYTDVSDTNQWLYCGRTASKNSSFGGFFYGSYFGADYGAVQNTAAITLTDQTGILNVDHNKNVITLNGESSYAFTTSTFTSAAPMTLLARNTNGTIAEYSSAKLYSCQIYDNGILVRDFIPCLNPEDVIGLYDIVNSVFYANSGTGTFTAGAEVEYETVVIKTASVCYSSNTFESYTGTYTVSEVVGTDGVTYNLYTLTGSGTLTLNDSAQAWMCGGGGSGTGGSNSIYRRGGGGGGGGYSATATLDSGIFVVTIGSANAATQIVQHDEVLITANKGGSGSRVNGGSGGSGGGSSYGHADHRGTPGTGDGISTYPFGITSLGAHCAGGGGGVTSPTGDGLIKGGNGGSNGSAGVETYQCKGGTKGGGNGVTSTINANGYYNTYTAATAGSFYGAGGGGGGYLASGSQVIGGKAGYQGVCYILVPA